MTSPRGSSFNGPDAEVLAGLAAQLTDPDGGLRRLWRAILTLDAPAPTPDSWTRAADRTGLDPVPRPRRPR